LERVDFPAALGDNPASTSYYAIGNNVFENCTSLKAVTFKESQDEDVTIRLGNYVFNGCTSLATIELPQNTVRIGAYAFAETAITEFTIPESVTDVYYVSQYDYSMGYAQYTYYNRMFYNCTQLKKVTIEGNITVSSSTYTYYLDRMFEGCTALETVDIKEGVVAMGTNMFEGCTSLKTVNVPESVEWMGRNVFAGLTASTTVNVALTELQSNRWTVFWNNNSDANFVFAK
jgi:hypothetical protein